ncbi:MAG: response regulator [Parvularculaceae bacterium]
MTDRSFRGGSLRVSLVAQLGLVALLVVSLCGLLIFAGVQNRASIENQQRVDRAYLDALELDEIIDGLTYLGAELSNSLSDESYDAFLKASARADVSVEEVDDAALRVRLRRRKEEIVDNAIAALDAYVVDDRATGDGHMARVRAAAAALNGLVQDHVRVFEEQRLREETAILECTALVQRTSAVVAATTVIIFITVIVSLWRSFFSPVEALAASVSKAAASPWDAARWKLTRLADNEIGRVGAALNTLLDAAETSIREARLRADDAEKAEQRWKALFNESPDAIVLLNPKTTELLERNPACDRLLCIGADEARANDQLTALELHRHEVRELKSFLSEVASKGCARNDALSCGLEERRIPVSVVGVTVPRDDGDAILLHIRDISAQREYERELKEAREEALRAAQSKSNFLANMSHEIRTPMNGVMGMAEVLANTELTPRQMNFVNIINKSSNALLTIINDILDFSKIDSGRVSFDERPFNLKTVVEDVISLVATKADEKSIELIVRYEPGLPEDFIGDDGRMRQALMNLVGNAIKFTEAGHVLVDVSGRSDGRTALLKARIEDTGVGVPEDKLDEIFEKFNQVDNSATRKFEGTGLGHAICRMLIEKMGGEIGVDSVVGSGSTFWFEIELPISDERAPKKVLPIDVDGKRALIVDDNPVNREILVEQLTSWRLRPVAVDGAAGALEAARRAAREDAPFDLLVLDYQMPEADGVTTFERIKAELGAATAPCVLLTSVSDDDNRGRARAAGVQTTLTKPARSSALFDAIVGVLSEGRLSNRRPAARAKADGACAGEEPSRDERGPLILVAEDNEVNRAVVGELLKSLGYDFILAEDGREAVDAVDVHAPDVVLMDVSMPVMNGLEATAEIKRRDAATGRKTIVVGLTANALAGDREKCLDAGMDDYLSKPVNRERLGQCVSTWLAHINVAPADDEVA